MTEDTDIIYDDREPSSIANRLESRGLSLSEQRLGIGDYVWSDVVIERKALSDFLSSLTSEEENDGSLTSKPRIWNQAKNMKDEFNKCFVIIHDRKYNLHKKAKKIYDIKRILGVISSLEYVFDIHVDWVENEKQFCDMLYYHYSKSSKELERPYPSKSPSKPLKERIENSVCQAKRVGLKKAKEVLKDYNSIQNIANADKEELKDKYGEKTGGYIYNLLCSEVEYGKLDK